MTKLTSTLLLVAVALAGSSRADSSDGGQVSIPLDVYQRLLAQAGPTTRPAPAGFALGTTVVTLEMQEGGTASARAQLAVDVFEDEWVLVPVLPAGVGVESAIVDGKAVQLLPTPSGLAWSTRTSGSHMVRVTYRVEPGRNESGVAISLPLPEAASTLLDATLPGTGLDVALVPGTVVTHYEENGRTRIKATIPASRGTLLSYRAPASRGYAMSRASYEGRLVDEIVVLRGDIDVELFDDASASIDLVPTTVTVSEVLVDGKRATILVENGRFATLVRGRGRHVVTAELQVPVTRGDGPPGVSLEIPRVPVSSFELALPGRKDVSVTPGGGVKRRFRDGATVATAHVPMSASVRFSWSEAVPEDVRAELRWNASLYHLLYAEEGVLFGRVLAQYEVSRGGTHVLELVVPGGVQINRVAASTGAVADWKVESGTLSVFLDRELRDQMVLEIEIDRALSAEGAEGLEAPLFRALGPQRQKGMVALLSDRDLALAPAGDVDETRFTRTGENQLPAFVREAVTRTVAHTFKYVDVPEGLRVAAVPPDREQGQFDARVDTLASVGDASLRVASSVEVSVKSGELMELQLALPEGVSLLDVVAPALREHAVAAADGRQLLTLQFTQEMEGQFRVELTYERVVGASEAEVELPRLEVVGAEIERGRVAVESLSAIEVAPAEAAGLSPLDVRELPRQLVLQTTNPILLAYKYAQAEPPYRLRLGLRRHEIAAVQQAAIDEGRYRTLVTADGLAVTTARFDIRNARRQFLRIDLPDDAEVWSARVDGRPTPPAVSPPNVPDGAPGGVLLPIPSSSDGFVVELVYGSRVAPLGRLGRLSVSLAVPDVLVTQTRWDVFLPTELSYGAPTSRAKLVEAGAPASADEMKRALEASRSDVEDPPVLEVPRSGVRFGLEKVYANESGQALSFSIPYASGAGATLGQGVVLAGVLLFGFGVHLLGGGGPSRVGLALAASGLALALVFLSRYPLSPVPTVALAVGAAALWQRDRLGRLREAATRLLSRRRAEVG